MEDMQQLTIQQVVEKLKNMDPTSPVVYDFGGQVPTTMASSRGNYSEPALGWGYGSVTVAALLDELTSSLTKTYHGWKGGEYQYTENHYLWVDNQGEWSETIIYDVVFDGYEVVLKTTRAD